MKNYIKQIINWFRSQYTISKLRVKNGDILIVKFKKGLLASSGWSFLGALRKTLDKRNMRDTLIMCLDKDCDLQSLPEGEMNKVGWFRKEGGIMTLFQKINFISHSGKPLDWKLECDALTDEDWECIAYLISKKLTFGIVIGIPQGGLKLAKALEKHIDKDKGKLVALIVDDVLTTGRSMEEVREDVRHSMYQQDPDISGVCCGMNSVGVVLFARGECPDWIIPIFQMNHNWVK